jgi:hypothetical protein
VLSTAAPPLTEVLQLASWQARQAEAERALALLGAALTRLGANHALSIEEFCEVVKSTEARHAGRSGANRAGEAITPEEEREYHAWVAAHPTYASAMQSFTAAQHPLLAELETLRLKGVNPASPGVQAVVDRHSELMTRHGVRALMVEFMAWNPVVTRRHLALSERPQDRTLNKDSAPSDGPGRPADGFADFSSRPRRPPARRAPCGRSSMQRDGSPGRRTALPPAGPVLALRT